MSSTTEEPYEFDTAKFKWPDYLVFGSVLAVSIGIGIFYGFFGKKNQTNEEYLLGGRQMHPFPVALSLLCSYVSSITLLGHPAEIYYYGTQLSMVLLCYIPLTLSLMYIYVPIYFNLQFTSVYEYLEWRFNRPIRLVLSLVSIAYGIFFMAMVVYGPAVSLTLVTGINHRILVAVIFLVCIFYSSFGGFKAVLWTDTLQAIIMLVSMLIVVIVGLHKVGGFDVVWDRILYTERNIFVNVDFDPRTRHTFWTAVIGGYFQWLPMYANQAQIQRYISLPSLRAVNIALLINLFGLFFLMGLCYLCGMVIFGTFFGCDPLVTGEISTADQILPIFVMRTLDDYPGLPGLFVAGITCAALSTVSSGVNALAASITEDYVKRWKPNLTESQFTKVSKCVAGITGLLAFGFVYIAELMGNIFGAATALLGILGGPTFGAFVCGMFFPWCNTMGVSIGLGLSFAIMAFFGIGQTIAFNRGDLPSQALSLDTSQCSSFNESYVGHAVPWDHWKEVDTDPLIRILQVSQLWYPAMGMITAVAFGLLFSLIASKVSKKNLNPPMESKLFIPVILKIWIKICPKEMMRLVKFKPDELLDNLELSNSKSSVNTPYESNEKIDYKIPRLPTTLEKMKTIN